MNSASSAKSNEGSDHLPLSKNVEDSKELLRVTSYHQLQDKQDEESQTDKEAEKEKASSEKLEDRQEKPQNLYHLDQNAVQFVQGITDVSPHSA